MIQDRSSELTPAQLQAHRTAPGSATHSNTPAVCGFAAALCVIGALISYVAGNNKSVLPPVGHLVTMVVMIVAAVALAFIGSWASREKRGSRASLADLMPQRVLAVIVGLLASGTCLFMNIL